MTAPFVWITGPLNSIYDFDAQYRAAEQLEKAGVRATWFASRAADISEQFSSFSDQSGRWCPVYCPPDVWLNPLLGDRPEWYEDWAHQYGYGEDRYDYHEDTELEGRYAWYARPLTELFPLTDEMCAEVWESIEENYGKLRPPAILVLGYGNCDAWPDLWRKEQALLAVMNVPIFSRVDALVEWARRTGAALEDGNALAGGWQT